MAELRLNGEMNLLSTRYRVSSDCACRFKRQKWMVEVLRETSSDIGRIGLTGHERELLYRLRLTVDPVQVFEDQQQRLHLAFAQQEALQRLQGAAPPLQGVQGEEGAVGRQGLEQGEHGRHGV